MVGFYTIFSDSSLFVHVFVPLAVVVAEFLQVFVTPILRLQPAIRLLRKKFPVNIECLGELIFNCIFLTFH